jgi:exopolyphosphatase/guanosine-5'-triphosphate,3'-diphosphate pyrophosphatase
MGHSHEQFHRQVDDVSFINPGSVGRPGDGNPQTGYALVSFRPFNVELIRLDYDVEAAADALRRKKLPESFAQMLLRGLSIDVIVKEDESNKEGTAKKCESLTRNSQERLSNYQADIEHSAQVKNLALDLFDSLERLHKLGRRERCWLECAAILHDVGLSEGVKGHHKKSMTIILNDTQLLFASQERRIIASITRYHRKSLPKQKHYNLATLGNKTVTKIILMAGLLRVADALDDSHSSVVKSLNVKIEPKRVTVECVSMSVSPLEEQAFNKKKDLFEKVFKKKMVLAWMQH